MDKDLEIFNYFVEELLNSEANILIQELDILLRQYIFNSFDLEIFNERISKKKSLFPNRI
mgnify:CR=1 FL=1